MGFEIVAEVEAHFLARLFRAAVKLVVASLAERQDVFFNSRTAVRAADKMRVWRSLERVAVDALMMVALPDAFFDGLGNGARLSAFA